MSKTAAEVARDIEDRFAIDPAEEINDALLEALKGPVSYYDYDPIAWLEKNGAAIIRQHLPAAPSAVVEAARDAVAAYRLNGEDWQTAERIQSLQAALDVLPAGNPWSDAFGVMKENPAWPEIERRIQETRKGEDALPAEPERHGIEWAMRQAMDGKRVRPVGGPYEIYHDPSYDFARLFYNPSFGERSEYRPCVEHVLAEWEIVTPDGSEI